MNVTIILHKYPNIDISKLRKCALFQDIRNCRRMRNESLTPDYSPIPRPFGACSRGRNRAVKAFEFSSEQLG
jgi:hypothetical protein